ncbi:MAG: cofactor-independent phosphoglycerate mutase [bacterium]
MKYIILLADGMADRPIASLGNKTPLEAAHTPNMDMLASLSQVGMVKTLVEGYPLGSDVGNMTVLGINPNDHYTGRAALEAANMKIEMGTKDVAFRCNLVTIKDNAMLDYSAGHISTEEAKILIKLIDKKLGGPDFRFYPGKSYRHIMVTNSGETTKTIAPHDITGQEIEPNFPQGAKSKILIELMKNSAFLLEGHEVNTQRRALGKNPANMMWLWGQGKKMTVPSLKETFGISGAVISAVDLVKGIGVYLGMEVIEVPGATGYIDTNYEGKADYALKALKKHDFVYLHVEATDETGHNGDIKFKIQAIEDFDKKIVGRIVEGMKTFKDYKIMVTSDHSTPVEIRTHTAEPVPFLIYTSTKPVTNSISKHSEKAAMETGVKFENGWELFPYFINNK